MQVYSFSELGRRANNEDCFALDGERVFVVCDGVGGFEKGEVASKIVAEAFLEVLTAGGDFSHALLTAQEGLDNWIINHPESKGMATTLALLAFREDRAQVAWCGDSRVYHFREGKIIHQTVDHSWVNDAVKAGIISIEEAVGHPKSNVITRAIQGSHRPAQLDFEDWGEIGTNDAFMLCTDGVLESWTDIDLEKAMSGSSVKRVAEDVRKCCAEASNDNATALFIQVNPQIQKVRDSEEAIGIKLKLVVSGLLVIIITLLMLLFWPKVVIEGHDKSEGAKPGKKQFQRH
jgi:serine/threonine protein phosphatase PrpC